MALNEEQQKDIKLKAENYIDNAEGDAKLKSGLFIHIKTLLYVEIFILALFLFLQGAHNISLKFSPFSFAMSFHLDEWAIRLFIFGTLLQTFGIIQIIAKHLYPQHNE